MLLSLPHRRENALKCQRLRAHLCVRRVFKSGIGYNWMTVHLFVEPMLKTPQYYEIIPVQVGNESFLTKL